MAPRVVFSLVCKVIMCRSLNKKLIIKYSALAEYRSKYVVDSVIPCYKAAAVLYPAMAVLMAEGSYTARRHPISHPFFARLNPASQT